MIYLSEVTFRAVHFSDNTHQVIPEGISVEEILHGQKVIYKLYTVTAPASANQASTRRGHILELGTLKGVVVEALNNMAEFVRSVTGVS